MAGMAFASVPLFDLFRQATGFGGTTQIATAAPRVVLDRTMAVRFNADVAPKLPWSFQPNQRQVSLRVGETGRAVYTARNLGEGPVTGVAAVNVTPFKAGKYFSRVQCFCFEDQRLEAGQEAEMAVSFFVDPAIVNDRNLDAVKTITLSFVFFRARDDGGSGDPANVRALQANQQSAAAAPGAPARR